MKNPSEKKYIKNILRVLCLIFGLTASTAWAAEPGQTEGETAIDAKSLYLAFQEDKEGAEQKYAGKKIRISGVVLKAGPDRYGLPAVDLSDSPDGKYYVICVLPFTDYLKLKGIKTGQPIIMEGEYRHLAENGLVVVKQSRVIQ